MVRVKHRLKVSTQKGVLKGRVTGVLNGVIRELNGVIRVLNQNCEKITRIVRTTLELCRKNWNFVDNTGFVRTTTPQRDSNPNYPHRVSFTSGLGVRVAFEDNYTSERL